VLVLAAPVTLLLGATTTGTRHRVVRFLAHPVVRLVVHPVPAAALHLGGLFVLYLTPVYAATSRHDAAHQLSHLHVLVAGCLFTWAVAGRDPAPRRPGPWVRLTVLVLAAGAHSVLAKLLYARAGELPPGSGDPVAELRAAAQLMYYAGDLVEVFLAIALFASWPGRRRVTALASQVR
jgi:putative membrane protein